jgi:hypothetical protein
MAVPSARTPRTHDAVHPKVFRHHNRVHRAPAHKRSIPLKIQGAPCQGGATRTPQPFHFQSHSFFCQFLQQTVTQRAPAQGDSISGSPAAVSSACSAELAVNLSSEASVRPAVRPGSQGLLFGAVSLSSGAASVCSLLVETACTAVQEVQEKLAGFGAWRRNGCVPLAAAK